MSLHVNPEYEKLLPKMSDQEFADLKASIQEEGQHYAIIVNEDLEILDGHHRFRACVELDIEPDFEVRKFENKLLEKKFVIEANLRRRHLNNFQLVELGVPLLEIEKLLAKKRQAGGGKMGRNIQLGLESDDAKPEIKAKATEVVAKKVGVSTRTFERGKKIMEKASEEDKQKLREGKASIAQVYREVAAPEQSTKRIEKIEDTIKAFAPALAEALAAIPKGAKHDPELNRRVLSIVLSSLTEENLFCPSCGHVMFECSRCHKTLRESLEPSVEGKSIFR
jgi:ParB-like chromosome segregation protein Spo0J